MYKGKQHTCKGITGSLKDLCKNPEINIHGLSYNGIKARMLRLKIDFETAIELGPKHSFPPQKYTRKKQTFRVLMKGVQSEVQKALMSGTFKEVYDACAKHQSVREIPGYNPKGL